MNTVGIIEARMGSRRFPGKVVAKIGSKESILYLIDRLKLSKKLKLVRSQNWHQNWHQNWNQTKNQTPK